MNTKGCSDKQGQQRRDKKTQCIECYQLGRWAGDDVCPKRVGKRSTVHQQFWEFKFAEYASKLLRRD